MSLVSLEQALNSWFLTTESEVVKVVAQVKADIDVAIQDIDAALKWLVAQAPNIAADLQTASSLVEQVPGLSGNPDVQAAIKAANLAVDGLNAFAAAANSGKTMPAAVVSGYVAVKQAQAAVASATAAAASSKAPAAASALSTAASGSNS